jgi:hypothetical protein
MLVSHWSLIYQQNKLKYEYEQSYEGYQDLYCVYEFKFYRAWGRYQIILIITFHIIRNILPVIEVYKKFVAGAYVERSHQKIS